MMGNGKKFETPEELPDLDYEAVKKKVEEGIWSISTRNKLELSFIPNPTTERPTIDGEEQSHHRAELKWRGVQLPSVSIWNSSKDPEGSVSMREFDAFIIEKREHHGGNQLVFKSLTDAPNF